MSLEIKVAQEPLIKAFLLTRQWRDTAKGIVLDFWFSSDKGPLHVLIEGQQAVFFVRQQDMIQVKKILTPTGYFKFKVLQLKNFAHQPVAGVYFNSQRVLYQAREQLNKHNINHYEADIRPVDRYLTERYLTGPVIIKRRLHDSNNKKQTKGLLINPHIKVQSGYSARKIKFRLMSIDIETAYDSNDLYSISLLCAHWHITLMMATNLSDSEDIEYFASESDLLLRFIDIVQFQDPDIFIGWNVVNFDFRFLQQKADQLKMSLMIGRNESLPVWRKAQGEQNHFFLLIPGRVVLDGIDALKSATWNFSSFSLDSVAQKLLKRGKLFKPAVIATEQYDPLKNAKYIKQLFTEDKISLAAYNLQDCQLVWDIFVQTNLVSFAIERARLTGLEMSRTGGSVAAFDNLYLPRLHRKGYVAPNLMAQNESISAPGGYVMNSRPGLYDSVLVLDYKSLYPSIIRTFRVDPYARIRAECLTEAESVPGFNGVSFARDDYILPDIIRSLWHARDEAKEQKNQALSQAIKIIMNSFYGVLGTPGCRVHDARLTSSITLRGHELIKQTAELISAAGYEVIYGDTDSVFVSLGASFETQEANAIANHLVTKINQYWREKLAREFHLESFLEMEYETHYRRFFMPTIRGSAKGSKKRYAGLIIENGKSHITYKGLETVRTDWTALAREVQQELYWRIFHDLAYEDYLKEIVDELQQGKLDDKLVYRKRLRQKLSDYKKNRPPHAQAALKAVSYAQNSDVYKSIEDYDRGGWIEYVITINGPEPVAYNSQSLDYEHYIDKQIAPAVDALLSVRGCSLSKIIQTQFELF